MEAVSFDDWFRSLSSKFNPAVAVPVFLRLQTNLEHQGLAGLLGAEAAGDIIHRVSVFEGTMDNRKLECGNTAKTTMCNYTIQYKGPLLWHYKL
jgi:hypothetical protein